MEALRAFESFAAPQNDNNVRSAARFHPRALSDAGDMSAWCAFTTNAACADTLTIAPPLTRAE